MNRRTKLLVAVTSVVVIAALVTLAVLNPLGFGEHGSPPASTASKPTASASPKPLPLPADQVCPDAGSIAAGQGDNKTEYVAVTGTRAAPLLLLGPNRHVVVAAGAVMEGRVTICGDAATLVIVGSMKGTALLQGTGSKIVLQDGAKLPPAYVASRVTECTTNATDHSKPACNNYLPR